MQVRITSALVLILALLTFGCSDSPTGPGRSFAAISIGTPTPANGSVIPIRQSGIQYFITRGSGELSIPLTVTSNYDADYAQLWVYLYYSGATMAYCGQNLPDAPAFQPFKKGQRVTVNVTGFQIGNPGCHVTEVRAYLHTRNVSAGGALTPPRDEETLAFGTLPVDYTFRRVE